MIEALNTIDTNLFLALNGDGGKWMDTVMWYASKTWPWIPLFIFLLFQLYKKNKGISLIILILSLAIAVTLSDRISVELFKEIFMRMRPSHVPSIHEFIHFVQDENGNKYVGGNYGFVSSHASNCAAAITFFVLLMKPIKTGLWVAILLWYLMVAYSRIYLGVHYPGDVLGGFILGVFCGWLASKIFQFAILAIQKREQKKGWSNDTPSI